MGLHDREYYREEPTGGSFQLRKPKTVVVWLMIINAAVYGGIILTTHKSDTGRYVSTVGELMKLEGDALYKPWKLYGLATYGFAHAGPGTTTGIMHILFNMYGLFLFGRAVEQKYGRAEFLCFYIASLLFSGVGWLLFETVTRYGEPPIGAIGASGAVSAVVILFCMNFPKRTLLLLGLIAVPAWVVGLLFVGFDIANAMGFGRENIAWQAHLAGALGAVIYAYSGIRFTALTGTRNPLELLKPKPNLRLHEPDDDNAEERYRDLDAKADALLEKIRREGEKSLTSKERRILEDYSRRMRQKHR